jgi:hypothetical protein
MTSSRTSTVLSTANNERPGKKLVLTSKLDSPAKVSKAGNILGKLESLEVGLGQDEKVTKSPWANRIAEGSITGEGRANYTAPGKANLISFKDIVRETSTVEYERKQRPVAPPAPRNRAMGLVYSNRPVLADQSNYSTFASHERGSDSGYSCFVVLAPIC